MISENSNASHLSDYKLQNKIGKGSFATVFKAVHIATNRICAIKRIEKACLISESPDQDGSSHYDDREVEIIRREIRISKKADHPLIVHFYETFEDDDYLYIVMEYIDGESMLNYVNSNGQLSEDQARYFFKQLLSCVEYLHNELHVTHRDLKAENIIIDVHNNIRLIDFGLSCEENSNGSNSMMQTVCGSPAYAAPELIQGEEYSNSVDIWSCGIVLYSMVFAALPFYDENLPNLFHKVVFEDPAIPKTVSQDLADLITNMLNKNPKERISIDKIKESLWFSASSTNKSLNIDFTFLLDATFKINNILLSHDVIFQLRRCGYQICRSSDEQFNQSDKTSPITSEDEILQDITNSLYTNPITTAYRILNTSRISQNVIKMINSFKFSASSLNTISSDQYPSGLSAQFNSIGPAANSYGKRRIRRNSSAAGCINNRQIQLSPLYSTSKDISNSNSQSNLNAVQNTNSNTNVNTCPTPSFGQCSSNYNNSNPSINSCPTPSFGQCSSNYNNSNPNINSCPAPSFGQSSNKCELNPISNCNSIADTSQNVIHNFVEESFQNSKENFPSSQHEVTFSHPFPPYPLTVNPNKALPKRRHMSFSSRTTPGAPIIVPKVSFAQTNF